MFDPNSRYYAIEERELTTPEGKTVKFKRRRFIAQADTLAALAEVTVTSGERLDLIAQNTLGDPLSFWLICDANNALHPLELTAEPGRRLRIPVAQS